MRPARRVALFLHPSSRWWALLDDEPLEWPILSALCGTEIPRLNSSVLPFRRLRIGTMFASSEVCSEAHAAATLPSVWARRQCLDRSC